VEEEGKMGRGKKKDKVCHKAVSHLEEQPQVCLIIWY